MKKEEELEKELKRLKTIEKQSDENMKNIMTGLWKGIRFDDPEDLK